MSKQGNKFGAFKGVFTPSILTILGVIMYLRLPWIVGQAGLWATLGIVLVAHIISVTTGLSVASIATDKKVETGGTYFMISRSLGLPIGGTLGLALFVGLSFSVSLYILGFSETLLTAFGYEVTLNTIRLTGIITLLSVTIITFISTNLALKTQFIILAVMILSVASILLGKHELTPVTPLSGSAVNSLPWIALFAIFFPAVTGFEAGVAMSGDLANPKKAIPRGTITAIMVGLVVYIGLVFFFSYTVERDSLMNDSAVLLNISLYSPIVVAGIWGATLSSAFGSILGAPRILQATAMDRITPKVFAKGVGKGNEPRNAIILTFFIALAGILIGELNVIARVVSIFFIITYGFLNLTCALENWAGSDFRPSFRIPVWIGIIGALACFIVMIQLDLAAMIGATILLGAIFLLLKRKELKLQSGDTWGGFWSSIVKYGLIKLFASDNKNQRNWRPNIILFSGGVKSRPHLIDLSRILVGNQGVFTNIEIVENPDESVQFDKTASISTETDSIGKQVITRKYNFNDIYEGITVISKVYGFTGFEPNTILMGWGKRTQNTEKFFSTIGTLHKLDFNLVFQHQVTSPSENKANRIDLWWNGNSRNLNFGIALLKYITTDNQWRNASVRVLVINYNNSKTDSIYALVSQILDNSRLLGSVKVINNASEKLSEIDIIKAESAESGMAIVELGIGSINGSELINHINQKADLPCTSLIIEASSNFEIIDAGVQPQTIIASSSNIEESPFTLSQKIEFPEKEILANEIQNISVKQETLEKNFLSNSILFSEQKIADFHDDITNLTEKFFSSIKKLDGKSLNTKSERGNVSKILTDFTFQSKNKLKQFQETTLKSIHQDTKSSLEVYLQEIEKQCSSLSDSVTIKFSKNEFQIKKNDRFSIRWFKFRSRLRGSLLGWPINQKVELSKAAETILLNNRLNKIDSLFNQFGLNSFAYINSIRRCLAETTKSIELRIVQQKNFDSSFNISQAQTDTNKVLDDALVTFKNGVKLFTHNLNTEVEKSIQRLSNIVSKPESSYLIKPYIKLAKKGAQIDDVYGIPTVWLKNLTLFTNKTILEFTLISLHLRFGIKLQKQVDELNRWAYSKLSDTIEKIKQTINELKTAPEIPDTSIIIENLNELKKPEMNERFENFFGDVNIILSELSEKIEVNDNSFFTEIDKGNFPESDVRTIELRRKSQFYIGTELISNVRKSMETLSEKLKETSSKLADKLRLAMFNIEDIIASEKLENSTELRDKLVNELLNDIALEETQLKKLLTNFETDIFTFLKRAIEPLNQLVFNKDNEIAKSKKEVNFWLFVKITNFFGSITTFINKNLVGLLYSQSEGIMLAQKLTTLEQETKVNNQAIQEMVEALSGKKEILQNVPFYYISLFSGSTTLNKDLWIERPAEQMEAEQIVSRYKNGYTGALLITGNRNSGKSTLSKYIASKYLPDYSLHVVRAPKGGTIEANDFHNALQKALNIQTDPIFFLNSSGEKRVIIINDLELWWERNVNGINVLKEIVRLINAFSENVFFVINCGSLAYKLINTIVPINANLMGHIECQPFDSKELKELVVKRHKTGGLRFILNNKPEENLSEWNYAKLFNRYFNISGGNPGYTQQLWLANINRIVDKTIYIKPPVSPSLSLLNWLNDDLWMIILQLMLHRRCSIERLSRIIKQDEPQTLTLITEMKRAGLVEERFPGVFAVNSILEPHLVRIMKEKGFY